MSEVRDTAGRRILYDAVGNGPPLLVLAGSIAGRHFLQPMITTLARSCHVIAMDNRDAGESDPESSYYTMADLATDAVSLLDALGLQGAHVLGVSMGGMIGLRMVLDYPSRVSRLVLVSCPLVVETGHRMNEPYPPAPLWWTDDPVEGLRRALPSLVTSDFRATLSEQELDSFVELARGNRITFQGAMRQEAAMTAHDVRECLAEIAAPTLVIHGDRDTDVPLVEGQELAARIPGAQLQIIKGAGHLVMFERADAFNRAVLDFVKERPT